MQRRVAGYVFFFSSRRRHTRFDCDWSSDVCSSDLLFLYNIRAAFIVALTIPLSLLFAFIFMDQIGRASCRERGVDLGGRRIIKKKKSSIRRQAIPPST